MGTSPGKHMLTSASHSEHQREAGPAAPPSRSSVNKPSGFKSGKRSSVTKANDFLKQQMEQQFGKEKAMEKEL